MSIEWQQVQGIPSRAYTCGYCGKPLASEKGWWAKNTASGKQERYIYVCHRCAKPTFFDSDGTPTPGSPFGNPVADVPDKSVADLYEEARRCTAVAAYTAAVLACRKLLMHIAVSKGAAPGESFVTYVEYLAAGNYIPPDARPWVDDIRARGNEANHEITIMKKEDAEELLSFSEMLLKVIYEFPAAVLRRTKRPAPAP